MLSSVAFLPAGKWPQPVLGEVLPRPRRPGKVAGPEQVVPLPGQAGGLRRHRLGFLALPGEHQGELQALGRVEDQHREPGRLGGVGSGRAAGSGRQNSKGQNQRAWLVFFTEDPLLLLQATKGLRFSQK